jgi:hypothetical protein
VETLGNNLSVPVVFAEGHGITGLPVATDTGLRPRPTETNPTLPFFDSSTVVVKEGITYYPQQTASTWQAGWTVGAPGGEQVMINWGDNLLARSWNANSVIRVETVLYQQAATTLTGYAMTSLFGTQRDEVFGTTGATTQSGYRTVFAVTPRLIIEKITGPGGSVVPGLPRFEGSVAAALESDGPGEYSAEVNGGGSIIYGFNWTLRQWDMPQDQKAGWWRITFTLDPVAKFSVVTEEGATPVTSTPTGPRSRTPTPASSRLRSWVAVVPVRAVLVEAAVATAVVEKSLKNRRIPTTWTAMLCRMRGKCSTASTQLPRTGRPIPTSTA